MINSLGYQKAIEALEDSAYLPDDLVLKGSVNWEYQWSSDFLPLDKTILEQDNYYGIDMFKKFIPIDFESFKDKSILIAGTGQKSS